jgi:hypothetical protein
MLLGEAAWIALIVTTIPTLSVFGTIIGIVWMRTKLKHRDLKLKEDQLALDERLRTEEINAKLLRMDDFGLSPVEIASLAENVRQLREEVAQLRQEINNKPHM